MRIIIDWDDEAFEKISKHNVTVEEIENLCNGWYFITKDPKAKSNGKLRYIFSGKTLCGKYRNAVIERIFDDHYKLITAFPMSENYIRSFKKRLREKGVEDEDKDE